MSNKAIEAYTLSRVSSDEQADGYSLEVQDDRLEKYCERKGIRILERFRLVESSNGLEQKTFSI
ncbi:recombinase family protein [Rickettsia endosymbiont of Ceutorhynchus obstrictus]|uniref:recombinase family protein n=1 Tax=Rickettsia endosymbiont of Ceutorhynchus obstrictus TaxID=3066249 RepID=UPI003132A5DA